VVDEYADILEQWRRELAEPDWNAAENEPGHVLNRTHWVEGGRTLILPSVTIATEEDLRTIPPLGLVEGDTYIVDLNGTEFVCVAWKVEYEGLPVVGLGDIYTGSHGEMGTKPTGEPFVLMEIPPEVAIQLGVNVVVQPFVEELTLPVVFSIYHNDERIHKLNGKFLPEGVPYIEIAPMVEVLPETTLESHPGEDGYFFINRPGKLLIGETYTVVWNGVEYEAKTWSEDGVPFLTNVETDVTTGENLLFGIMLLDFQPEELFGYYGMVIAADGASEVTLSIRGPGEKPHKLSEKLMPDGYGFSGSYNDLTDKPALFSGSYDDLTNKPEIPSVEGLASEEYVTSAIAAIPSPLPTVNTENNGAFLRVVDGNWSAVVLPNAEEAKF
jgi:hypothetical protein